MFCTGLTRAAQAGQKSIVPARRAQRTNQGRTPFIMHSKSPQETTDTYCIHLQSTANFELTPLEEGLKKSTLMAPS